MSKSSEIGFVVLVLIEIGIAVSIYYYLLSNDNATIDLKLVQMTTCIINVLNNLISSVAKRYIISKLYKIYGF